MNKKIKERYYFVSYSYEQGFGNIFFKASPYLNIREAEAEIFLKTKNINPIIITINEITKWQYNLSKK